MFEEIKNLLLAGVGGAAITAEKAQESVNNLVEKGRLTVEEGKKLNEELIQRGKEEVSVNTDQTVDRDELQMTLIEMNVAQRQDLEKLEDRIADLEARLAGLENK